jgi:chromosome segregation ATPase
LAELNATWNRLVKEAQQVIAAHSERLKAFEDAQRTKIEAQRKRVTEDMTARAEHAKEVRSSMRPALAALEEADQKHNEHIQRIQALTTQWNDKATGVKSELEKIRDKQLAVKAEHEELSKRKDKGEAEEKRLIELAKEHEALMVQAGEVTGKLATYSKNAAALEEKRKKVGQTGLPSGPTCRKRRTRKTQNRTKPRLRTFMPTPKRRNWTISAWRAERRTSTAPRPIWNYKSRKRGPAYRRRPKL